jgi:hypothetical protein
VTISNGVTSIGDDPRRIWNQGKADLRFENLKPEMVGACARAEAD